MTKNKKLIFPIILGSVIAIIIFMMVTGIIPQQIAGISASYHAKTNYSDMNLTFNHTEFSTAFGSYFVFFDYGDGQSVAFQMTPKIFPVLVLYDPLNPPF